MYCAGDEVDIGKDKFSCKGIQNEGNNISYKTFESVLHGNKHSVVNQGFRYVDGTMKSYEQTKIGLSFLYYKRMLGADGVSTTPLLI
jgi:hypothetical protein